MREYVLVLKIFAAFVFGACAGSLIYSAAARVTFEKRTIRRVPRPPLRLAAALCFASASALLTWRFSSLSALFFSFTAFAFLLFHSLTDIENGHIYDLPVAMMTAAGMMLRLRGGVPALADGMLGASAGWALIYAVRILSRGGVGPGDATLMLGVGALLGWRLTLLALYCGVIAGGLFVIPMLLLKKKGARDKVPLAPFLAFGSLFSILAGESVCEVIRCGLAWPWAA